MVSSGGCSRCVLPCCQRRRRGRGGALGGDETFARKAKKGGCGEGRAARTGSRPSKRARSAGEITGSLVLFIGKGLLFCAAVALIESTIAKFRIFRLPDLLFTSFIISIIAIGLIG